MNANLKWILIWMLSMTLPGLSYSQPKKPPFKLAVAQMKVVGGALETNLEHAAEMIQEAAENGAQLVLLPEAMDLGWTDPSALTEAEPVPDGKTCRFLSEMARKVKWSCSTGRSMNWI